MLALFPVNARIHARILTVLQFIGNYYSNGYFQKKTGTVSNTIKGRCSLGYKRGHSEVCRYIFYKAQYRALPERLNCDEQPLMTSEERTRDVSIF